MIVAHITIMIIYYHHLFIFVETKFTIQTKQPNKVMIFLMIAQLGGRKFMGSTCTYQDFTNLKLVVPLFWYMISPDPKLPSCIM